MSKKDKNQKKKVVEDEKDKAIREMGEASRKIFKGGCCTPMSNPTACMQVPGAIEEEKTGDKDSDDILKKINDAIGAGGPPVTVTVKLENEDEEIADAEEGEEE